MSKIVVLIASPRADPNSETITDIMVEGARAVPENKIIVHRLDDLKSAHGCKACHKCKPSNPCVQKDDISIVIDDIRKADVVIASTPLYFNHSASQYKMLEDRLYCLFGTDGRSLLKPGKKIAVVVTCGGDVDGAKACAKDIEGVYKTLGFESLGAVCYADSTLDNNVAKNAEVCKKARAIGQLIR